MNKWQSSQFKPALSAIVVLFMAYLLFPFIDEACGTPLIEDVTVTAHHFTPAHTEFSGKMNIQISDFWELDVANAQGRGSIRVTSQAYKDISDGQPMRVGGTRGRFGGHWYLDQVIKFL